MELRKYLSSTGFDYKLVLAMPDVKVRQRSDGIYAAPDRLEYTLDNDQRIRVIDQRVYSFSTDTGWSQTESVKPSETVKGLLSPYLRGTWKHTSAGAEVHISRGKLRALMVGERLRVVLTQGPPETEWSFEFSNRDAGQHVDDVPAGTTLPS